MGICNIAMPFGAKELGGGGGGGGGLAHERKAAVVGCQSAYMPFVLAEHCPNCQPPCLSHEINQAVSHLLIMNDQFIPHSKMCNKKPSCIQFCTFFHCQLMYPQGS